MRNLEIKVNCIDLEIINRHGRNKGDRKIEAFISV